jgi:hypothetical protein
MAADSPTEQIHEAGVVGIVFLVQAFGRRS